MKFQAPDDFDHHHHGGQGQDAPCAFLRAPKFAAEIMAVLPIRNVCRMHSVPDADEIRLAEKSTQIPTTFQCGIANQCGPVLRA